jgi:hypothetical protein
MNPMKKHTALAVTVGVWIAALGSAAALTYDLNPTPRPAPEAPSGLTATTPKPSLPVKPAAEPSPVLMIPPVTIVAAVPRAPVAKAAKPPVDITAMHCADWRSLDMGSGRVQVCQ